LLKYNPKLYLTLKHNHKYDPSSNNSPIRNSNSKIIYNNNYYLSQNLKLI